MSRKSKLSKPNFAKRVLLVIYGVFFPPFNELQYIAAVVSILTSISFSESASKIFFKLLIYYGGIIYFSSIVGLMVFIVKRHVFSDMEKYFICLPYYGFFGVIAMFAFKKQPELAHHVTMFQWVNFYLIRILLILAITRALIMIFALTFKSSKMMELTTLNFRDTQYRPIAFILASCLAALAVVVMRHYYSDTPTIMLLSYTYSTALLTSLRPYFRDRFIYVTPKNT